jgi:hypothetical protein
MKRFRRSLAAAAGIASVAYAAHVGRTWLHYGRPRRARGKAADPLLDRFMPASDVVERHAVAIAAPADVTFAAAEVAELDSSRIIRAIFKGRELILRSKPDRAARPKALRELMTSIGWAVLAEDRGHELVFGAVTRPWEANPTFRPVPPEEFAAFAEPDHVKIAWTIRAEPAPDGSSVFHTETRAVATDRAARRKFRLYWSFLSPGIVLIRKAMLPAVKAAAERRWHLEGDDIVPEATAQLTHAILIDAPPGDVWPWLLQMGCRRAGWYSWDRLDNGGVRSADRIIPELQRLAVGDSLPARPVGTEGFEVLRIVPERALVLRGLSSEWLGTWAFVLEPIGTDKTRLVTRYRAGFAPSPKMALALPFISAVHAFMERKQLRTIKHHAEQLHGSAGIEPCSRPDA